MEKVMNKKEQARAAKRIEVIKDVLKRLRYLELSVYHYLQLDPPNTLDREIPAHKQISKIEKNCQVCAKGALFLSHIRKYNKISMDEVLNFNSSSDCSALDEFDQKNLDLVEVAFEQNTCSFGGDNTYEDINHAYNFGYKFGYSDKERLKAILKNMLKNNGIFVPTPV